MLYFKQENYKLNVLINIKLKELRNILKTILQNINEICLRENKFII